MSEVSKVSSHGYSDAYGPNVAQILAQATRVIRGPIPLDVRRQLQAAVRDGVLGRLKKDGLKPEIFYHPSHKNGAIELQKREAEYAVKCIAGVVASPADVRAGIEAMGGDVLEYALSERTKATAPASQEQPSTQPQDAGQAGQGGEG